jgi:pyruvate dehydrogenase E2 component (dihydrolipoamide acetyltransferase)
MAQEVIMPRQGISVESCIIGEWMKKEGDAVKAGDILFTYETDKAAFAEESPVDGVMLRQFYHDGDEVPCLKTVCIIGEPGEDIGALMPEASGDTSPAKEEIKAAPKKKEETAAPAAQAPAGGAMKVSLRAHNLADRSHADLTQAVGTGPEGRIIERDVAELIRLGKKTNAAVPASAVNEPPADVSAYTEVPLSNMRKIVGGAMHESLMNMAQLTLNASFYATQIMAFRMSTPV